MVISESSEKPLFWRRQEGKPIAWAEVLEQEHLALAGGPEALQQLIHNRNTFERKRSEILIRILDAGAEFIEASLKEESLPAPRSSLQELLALVQDAEKAYKALIEEPEACAEGAWQATDQALRRGLVLEMEWNRESQLSDGARSYRQALRRFLGDFEASFGSDEAWMPYLLQQLTQANRTALCLSGGGIRSASFSLGVIQGLSRLGLLKRFDYLSTVSGGGFTGGWLSAWIHREQGDVAKVERELFQHEPKWAGTPPQYAHGPEPAWEAPPVWRLRVNSNYLAPRLGVLSADIWTLVASILRNCLVHWLVLVPMLLALLAVPRILQASMRLWTSSGTAFSLGVLLFFAAFVQAFRGRPQKDDPGRNSKAHAALTIACTILSGILLTLGWGGAAGSRTGSSSWQQGFYLLVLFGVVAASAALFWSEIQNPSRKSKWIVLIVVIASTLLGPVLLGSRVGPMNGVLLGALLGLFLGILTASMHNRDSRYLAVLIFPLGMMVGLFFWWVWSMGSPWVLKAHWGPFTVIGLPLVLLLAFLCTSLVVAVGSRWRSGEGSLIDNADREWFARLGAWSLICSATWLMFSAISIYGPLLVINAPAIYTLVTSGTLGVALGGILSSRGRGEKSEPAASPWSALGNNLARIGSLAGALLILVGLATAMDWLLCNSSTSRAASANPPSVQWSVQTLNQDAKLSFHLSGEIATRPSAYERLKDKLRTLHEAAMPPEKNPDQVSFWKRVFPMGPLLLIFLGGTGLLCLFGFLFPLQEFSLHALYRNRLIRAYLGASHKDRKPDPFTGFAREDDFPVAHLSRNGVPQRPFHVINVALNHVYGEKLAWQERKASSFTISPLHCGTFFQLGYRSSEQYAKGITLGTAMTISGAAANPNMGYHSSPIMAFTMTFFAVRLGIWLGSPGTRGDATFTRMGPAWGLRPVLGDAFGLATCNNPYISLSDGGHFENLGLYEMAARRCRLIVVCDAGADPKFQYENLGNAIRKIRIDHGIPIHLHQELPRQCTLQTSNPESLPSIVKGTLEYSAVDGGDPKQDGLLIYIKTHLWEAVPADIRTYALNHRAFPHEGTSDQFFSESQFESYRALGESIVAMATPRAFAAAPTDLFEWASQLRIPSSPS